MSNFLTMRSFPNQRAPTVEKIRSDGIRMYCEARYVIVLNEEGEVVEKINRSITYTGNFLVILAPVIYKGWKVNLSVVLEIGFSRSVPYQQFEKWLGEEKVATKGRRPICKLTDEKVILLLSLLSDIVKIVALEETHYWKSVTYGGEKNPARSRRIDWKCGIFASIPVDEEILCYAVYVLDIETRSVYLKEKSFFIKFWFRNFKLAHYSRNQLRSFTGAQKVAEMIMNAEYPKHYLQVVIGSLSSRNKILLELCVRAFSKEPKEGEEYKELEDLLKTPEPPALYTLLQSKFESNVVTEIKSGWNLNGYIWDKRDKERIVHAKNALRFEIGLDKKDREKFYKR